MLQDRKTPWIQDISYQTLPKCGYIAILGKHPIAAGFLRKVEGGYGQLDTFVSNPYFGSKLRNEAINNIVDNLLQDAETQKLRGIIAITQDESIVNRAKDRNFVILPQVILGLNLSRK